MYVSSYTYTSIHTGCHAARRRTGLTGKNPGSGRTGIRWLRSFAILAGLIAVFTSGAMMQAFAGDDRSPVNSEQTAGYEQVSRSSGKVTVMPGDTLWDLASAHAPDGTNLQRYIYEIKQLNHLDSPVLYAGQELLLPE